MRSVIVLVMIGLLFSGCSPKAVSLKSLLGMEKVEVRYLLDDGTWVSADSLGWSSRTWYRELRFDTDCDGEWNYLYAEVYDDLGGWTWIPTSVRINPEEEPDLAERKRHLVADREDPPGEPGLDDFGYRRRK
jgi:hypothetical protein